MPDNRFVAIVVDEYIDYRKVIVDHISGFLREAGYGTLCVAGRELNPATQYHQAYDVCNQIYRLIERTDVAGIVCLSGAIGQNIDLRELQKFVAGFTVPVVSFGLQLDGVPGVVVDDTRGMTQLMEHLLGDPQRRHFVFVRGLITDTYSVAREEIFRRTLEQHGRHIGDCTFLSGNYDALETYNAVSRLLADKQSRVDAIVAVNDIMALSAVKAVNASGLRIPQDILVSGFDDTQDATRNAPALTTVRQPLLKMAELNVRLLLGQLTDTQNVANDSVLQRSVSSELVVRGSTVVLAAEAGEQNIHDAESLSFQLGRLMSGLPAPAGFDLASCCSAMWDTLSNRSDAFENYLQNILHSQVRTADSHWWSNLCHQLEKLSLKVLRDDSEREHRAIISASIARVQERIWSVSMDQAFEVQRLQSLHTSMQTEMSSCTELVHIVATMGRWLESVGAKRCFLVRYTAPSFDVCETAELIHVYVDGQTLVRQPEVFATEQVLPSTMTAELNSGVLVLNPIYAGNNQFGYVLLDPDGIDRLQIDSVAHAIGNAMRNQYLISTLESQAADLQEVNTSLVHLANHDVLTGLPNRLQFQKYLCERCDAAMDASTRLALLFIDLDGFKSVNDTLGHGAGDLLLQQVSSRLQKELDDAVGDQGFLARLGGDEFTVVLNLSGDEQAVEVLSRRLLDSLTHSYNLEQDTVQLSASIGYANFPEHGDTADALLKSADTAMYRAKEMGKNRIVLYASEVLGVQQPDTEKEIVQALGNGQMQMRFQPRVDMQTGAICAVEALMRWFTDEPGAKSVRMNPDQFIPIAERSGLISQLDEFALQESCQVARQWQLDGTPLCVSVNVSVITLQQENFLNIVERVLSDSEVDPDLIEIEITETAAMTNVEHSIRVLSRLREMGVRLSIDDFGTGYSSLNYLKRLPVNNLKIDKSFIRDIDVKADYSADNAIVKAVVALGKSLKFALVAEGVETEEQVAFIRELGCEQAQGFYFSKPVDVAAINALLHAPVDKAA